MADCKDKPRQGKASLYIEKGLRYPPQVILITQWLLKGSFLGCGGATKTLLSYPMAFSQVLPEYGRRYVSPSVRPSVRPSVNRSRAEPEQIWLIWPILGLFRQFWAHFGPIWTIYGLFWAYLSPIWPILDLFEPYLAYFGPL